MCLFLTWFVLQTSLCLFFSCSLCTISSSERTETSRKSGHSKKETNLRRVSSRCGEGTSKWKLVCSEAVYALELPPRSPGGRESEVSGQPFPEFTLCLLRPHTLVPYSHIHIALFSKLIYPLGITHRWARGGGRGGGCLGVFTTLTGGFA